jgi:hypothetical protein
MLTGDVMASLRRVSPLLSLLGLHATRYNSILIQFSISNARDGAWYFAEELSEKPAEAPIIEQARDKSIAELATGLTRARGLMCLTLWGIHLFEWRNPARIIQVLQEGGPDGGESRHAGIAAGLVGSASRCRLTGWMAA